MRRSFSWNGQAQSAMDRGTRVGGMARGYVPGGVVVDLPYDAYDERLTRTRQFLQDGGPLRCSNKG